MITKKVVYDAIIAAIIIVVQYLFLKVYRMGSDILIEMMNIKYNQDFQDTVAFTTIM